MKLQAPSRAYRGLAFLIFLTMVLCGTDRTPARAAPKKTAAQKPRVEDLLRAHFKRVPGDAHGKSVLDTGGPESWYSAYASSSTVDFDGALYRIWFVGGSPTNDPGVPYGYSDRIGMATSRDGIHWEVANDGKPVLSDPPVGNFDTAGPGSNYSVHPTKMLMQDRRVRVWYTGEDGAPPHYQRTGLMEAILP